MAGRRVICMCLRVVAVTIVVALLVSGCFSDAPEGQDEIGLPFEEDETKDVDTGTENETDEEVPVLTISGSKRLRLEGPGPAELRFLTGAAFEVADFSYNESDGVEVEDPAYWVAMLPEGSDGKAEDCSASPAVLFWHNTVSGSAPSWEGEGLRFYTLVYDTPPGTWLELEIREEDADAAGAKAAPVATRQSLLEASVLPSDPSPEGSSTGPFVHGSAEIEFTAEHDGVIVTRYQATGFHLGPRSMLSQSFGGDGQLCRSTESSGGAFSGLNTLLVTFVPANTTMQWNGEYEATTGFNSNGVDRHVFLRLPSRE